MKKLSFILVLTMLFSLCAVSVSAAPAVDGRKTITAYTANVKIDGVIDSCWLDAETAHVDIVKENASAWFGDTSKVAGTDYATLDVKVLWDGDSSLYLLYMVTDQLISTVGENPWDRDSIELFVQYDNTDDDPAATRSQIRWFSDSEVESGPAELIDYAYGAYADGFVVEIEFDVSAVSGGNYLGIDFQYNDDAEGKGVRNVCLGWSDAVDAASSDSTVYGQCELSSTKIEEVTAAREAAEKAAAEAAEAAAADNAPAAEDAPAAATPVTADTGILALCALMGAAAVVCVKNRKH